PNEDAIAVAAIDDGAAVLLVADGMGGTPAGEQASTLALQSVVAVLAEIDGDASLLRSAILDGFERANEAVRALGVGAGTTLAAVEINGQTARPYHVGDSEILVVGQRGRIKLQTLAHSPVAYAVEAGLLDESEAMHHEERHIVSNMIGAESMRIDIGSPVKLAQRDTVLLASDGLTDNLEASEIVEHIRRGPLSRAAARLADQARRRMETSAGDQPSKPDDLSFVLFRLC
ncbi:MAG: serine/threonine-protein phosphatase, partial [Planctomycetales bacterium]|nr:serine/threonine-protein phosphatase [Planctomycetales bacterium]